MELIVLTLGMHIEKTLRKLALALMAVAFLGFLDAMYLTAHRFFGVPIQCNLTHRCDTVLSSSYSEILGVPVVVMGVLFYLTVFFGGYLYLEHKNKKLLAAVSLLTFGGLLFSIWMTVVQAFILHAFCQYCLLSAASSTALFLLGLTTLKTLARISDPSPLPDAAAQE